MAPSELLPVNCSTLAGPVILVIDDREVVRFGAEDAGDADVVDELARRGDGDVDVGPVVAVLELERVGLAADLDAAGVVDLLRGQRDAGADRVAGRDERAGFRGHDADLDDVVARRPDVRGRKRQGRERDQGQQWADGFHGWLGLPDVARAEPPGLPTSMDYRATLL